MAGKPVRSQIKRTADRPRKALPPDHRPLRKGGTQSSPGKSVGTVSKPVPSGEAQPGDLNKRPGNLGGPVDVFPLNQGLARETLEG